VKQRFNPVNAVEKRRNACDALGHCDKQSCIVSEGTPDLSGWHLERFNQNCSRYFARKRLKTNGN
jgi:hypothetical protein